MDHVHVSSDNRLCLKVVVNPVLASFTAHSRVLDAAKPVESPHVSAKGKPGVYLGRKKEVTDCRAGNLRASSIGDSACVDTDHAKLQKF